jgi:hypothetical protein
MKPWSSASSASTPPAASAAALTVSTSSRDETQKQVQRQRVRGGIGDRQLGEERLAALDVRDGMFTTAREWAR